MPVERAYILKLSFCLQLFLESDTYTYRLWSPLKTSHPLLKPLKEDASKYHINFYFNQYSHFPSNRHSFNLKEKETQQELINPTAIHPYSKFHLKKRPYFLTFSHL